MLIWLILTCLSLMAGLYICAPLYNANHQSRRGVLAIFAAILVGTAGLYALIGRSDLTRPSAPENILANANNSGANNSPANSSAVNPDALSLEQLTLELEQRLTAQPEQPTGWLLYARSLLQLGRFDEGLEAYNVALEQTGGDENVAAELSRAREFVTTQRIEQSAAQQNLSALQGSVMPVPDQATIDAAGELDEQDRAAFIESMVAGLAARLDSTPEDQAGWARLLRARGVLGQTQELAADKAKLEIIFADDPEALAAIYAAADLEP